MPRQYPQDFRDRAVRLVTESREDHETEWAAIQIVASRLSVGAETLRKWMRRSEIDAGVRPGVSTADQAEIRRLKKEVTELKRANEILRTASAFGARPTRIEMIRYVDAYRDQFGVELMCRVLGNTVGGFMTSRGYRSAKTRPLSQRAIHDQVRGDEMERLHAENYGVYGVRKMHHLMRRQGWLVGRDQVRVMKTLGITGVRRGRTTFTPPLFLGATARVISHVTSSQA